MPCASLLAKINPKVLSKCVVVLSMQVQRLEKEIRIVIGGESPLFYEKTTDVAGTLNDHCFSGTSCVIDGGSRKMGVCEQYALETSLLNCPGLDKMSKVAIVLDTAVTQHTRFMVGGLALKTCEVCYFSDVKTARLWAFSNSEIATEWVPECTDGLALIH